MAKDENPEVRQLREIQKELKAINGNTAIRSWNWFMHGFLYGAGWIVGSLIAILLIGWGLSFLGIFPGLDRIATDFQTAFSRVGR